MNFVSRNKVVYIHTLNDGIVYVGSGRRGRVNSRSCRSSDHLKIWDDLKKVILYTDLTEVEAKEIESKLITENMKNNGFLNRTQNVNQVLALDWELLNDHLYYDATSKTCLRWKSDFRKRIKDAEAGTLSGVYGRVGVNGRLLQIHRVIWALLNKRDILEGKVIDHIDRDKLNNKIDNLREVDSSTNMRNKTHRISNTGHQGITDCSKNRYFSVQFRVNDKSYFINFSYGLNQSRAKVEWFSSKELALNAAINYRNTLINEGVIVLTTGTTVDKRNINNVLNLN